MSPSDPPVGADAEIVLAPDALLPTVTAFTVVPVIVPPVIATELAFCVDMVPSEPVAAVTAASTNAVVAICVVLVLGAAVGARGVPVKVGEAANTKLELVVPVAPDAV